MTKVKFTPVSNHKKWLTATANFYGVSELSVIESGKKSLRYNGIRNIFFTLCLRDNINLYSLSKYLGLHRTSVRKSLKEFKLNVSGEVTKIIKSINHV